MADNNSQRDRFDSHCATDSYLAEIIFLEGEPRWENISCDRPFGQYRLFLYPLTRIFALVIRYILAGEEYRRLYWFALVIYHSSHQPFYGHRENRYVADRSDSDEDHIFIVFCVFTVGAKCKWKLLYFFTLV